VLSNIECTELGVSRLHHRKNQKITHIFQIRRFTGLIYYIKLLSIISSTFYNPTTLSFQFLPSLETILPCPLLRVLYTMISNFKCFFHHNMLQSVEIILVKIKAEFGAKK